MSDVLDVGDAFELTFNTAAGADVTVTWIHEETSVYEDEPVAESPAASGKFPHTFQVTDAGMWSARFRAEGAASNVETYFVRARAIGGPPPLAAIGDVKDQYGTMTLAQEGLTGSLLRSASALVRSRFPLLATQIAEARLDREVVALGVANMILRVLRNPGGLRSETIGPFSRTYDTGHAAGLLTITVQDAAMFVPVVVPSVAGIGTVRLAAGLAPPVRGCDQGERWRH